jgi:hypothetical protein
MLRIIAKPLAETLATAASSAAKTPTASAGGGASQATAQAVAAGASDHLGALAAMSQQRRRVSVLSQPTETVPSKKKDVDVQVAMGGHVWLETTAQEQAHGAPKAISATAQKGSDTIESIAFKGNFPDGQRFAVQGARKPLADVTRPYEPASLAPLRRTDLGEMSPTQAQSLGAFADNLNRSETTYFVVGQGAHSTSANCVDVTQAALQHVGMLDPSLPVPEPGTRPQDLHDQIDEQSAKRGNANKT